MKPLKTKIDLERTLSGVEVAIYSDDKGPLERHMKGDRIQEVDIYERSLDSGMELHRVTRNFSQRCIDRLINSREITRSQWRAGLRLLSLWHLGGYEKGRNLVKVDRGHKSFTESQLDARDEFNRAMKFLGTDLNDVAYDLIISDMPVGTIEQIRHWRKGTGKPIIQMALRQLEDYYKMA